MNTIILANKWRPKQFKDFVGQEYILNILKNSLILKRIHHTYLFSGSHGIGKTSLARLFAKCLNCKENITEIPCDKCDNCKEIDNGCFIDLFEIDAASRTKVEEIKEVIENIKYKPIKGRFKIYIIDEVHMLSRYSFNALLKTLEEPPSHIKFILATTEVYKIPATIMSRCLHINLKLLTVEEIYKKLINIIIAESISVEEDALLLIANYANGSMRDAISITDQAISLGYSKITVSIVNKMLGKLDTEKIIELIEFIIQKKIYSAIEMINIISSMGINWDLFIVDILNILHSMAMLKKLKKTFDNKNKKIITRLYNLNQLVEHSDINFIYKTFLIGRKEITYAPNPKIGIEMIILKIVDH